MNRILMLALRSIFMAPADGAGGGGGHGDHQITPADARAFVTGFVPDPKLLEAIDDTTAVAWHGHLNKVLGDHSKKTLETHDWRKEIAADDPERLKTLERFASPKALYESYDQFRARMAKGELKVNSPFPDKGTDEQKAQWRTENGIPPTPDKYEIKLPDGVVIGENDKPVLEGFTKYAHENNIPAAHVNAVANWWYKERQARVEAARAEFDANKQETAAALGQEWGPEYKPNLNKIQGVIDATIPAENAKLKTLVNNAIATNPDFARMFAQIALQLNPGGTLVPGDRGANESSVVDGIKGIEKMMRENRGAYDKDEGAQKKYRDYLAAYKQLTGKDWGSPQ